MLKAIVSVFYGSLLTGLDRTRLSAPTRQMMVACLLGCLAGSQMAARTAQAQHVARSRTEFVDSYGKLSLSFEANQGQENPAIRYMARKRILSCTNRFGRGAFCSE